MSPAYAAEILEQLNTDQLDRLAEIKEEILVLLSEALDLVRGTPEEQRANHWLRRSGQSVGQDNTKAATPVGCEETIDDFEGECRRLVFRFRRRFPVAGLRRPTWALIFGLAPVNARITAFVLLLGVDNPAAPKKIDGNTGLQGGHKGLSEGADQGPAKIRDRATATETAGKP